MSSFIPWRIKKFLAYNFPLVYACFVNKGIPRTEMGDGLWLEKLWEDKSWDWPVKNQLVLNMTKTNDRILDLGTGTGGILRFLKSQGYQHLSAMDCGAYPVERLRELDIDARQGLLPEIPFENDSCDFVIASQVLEHIVSRRRFLQEISRVLASDGRAVIFVPDRCLSPLDEPTHVAVYNIASLAILLQRHFRVQRLESIRDDNHDMNVLFALVYKI